MKIILFIDWENFKKKLETVFKKGGAEKPKWNEYNFLGLFGQVLQGIEIDRKIFYAARVSVHPLTKEKSKELAKRPSSEHLTRIIKRFYNKANERRFRKIKV